jgi:hypothetical protein
VREIIYTKDGLSVVVETVDGWMYDITRENGSTRTFWAYGQPGFRNDIKRLYNQEVADFIYNHFITHRPG